MDDTTDTPVRVAVLAFCRRHRTFYPYLGDCPTCTAPDRALPGLGLTLVLGAAGAVIVALCVLALVWG